MSKNRLPTIIQPRRDGEPGRAEITKSIGQLLLADGHLTEPGWAEAITSMPKLSSHSKANSMIKVKVDLIRF